MELAEAGVLDTVRRGADRRQDRRHQEGRRPPAVQGRHAQDRPGDAAIAAGQQHPGRRWISPSASATPCILRPSFTLGGTGGGIAYNQEELEEILERGLALSPVHEVLIEESALGWKEFELEVMRDLADNCIIVCSIENFDPMGVHTGDSITVAPAQTLTDREYQMMRDGALRCLREIGVDTGGSNVQFAINPARRAHGDHRDEPARVAQFRAGLQGYRIPHREDRRQARGGYRLDEIRNDITRKTPACFEPTIDYVVAKIPKWAFEKFPGVDNVLGTQMKSSFRQTFSTRLRCWIS